ncbi:DUF4902 domain-containing protein [Duganella sp. Leaf61]|uniref:DUF4902 domain-containing protein n=1 Tax=Duganella sp. Leaf61 TaxID=1736227 RepID=UPI0009E75C6F|nr:DUF4902 domain-containing protein [Duganella sp. Leaf61]
MSNTGYVYLTFPQLQAITLSHLISGMDEDGDPHMPEAAVVTAITGYTEWIAKGKPTITIGWDWQMLRDDAKLRLLRVSEPASNVMLRNAAGVELGHGKSAALLSAFVDSFDWQTITLDYLNDRYCGITRQS